MPDDSPYLTPRFFEAVRRHLFSNFSEWRVRPAIMGVFGPPGEGQTFQLERSIEACNCEIAWLHAGELESNEAGEPAKRLVEVIEMASVETIGGTPTAVVLHDVDTTLGEWKDNTGTVNHQHLLAELMHFADRPATKRFGGRRVPVFVTGNDATKVYDPLTRAQRMSLFRWTPTREERAEIVDSILMPFVDQAMGSELVDRFPNEPVAFFADIAGVIRERQLAHHAWMGTRDMRVVAGRSKDPSWRPTRAGSVDRTALMEVAETMSEGRTSALRSFLRSEA